MLVGVSSSPSASSVLSRSRVVLFTKLVSEGDSITSTAESYATRWSQDNPAVPFQNLAVGSSAIATMVARISGVVAAAPSHMSISIGANDLNTAMTADAFLTALYDYIVQVKAAAPTLKKVLVCAVLPSNNTPGFNAKRNYVNGMLRAAVGNQIDGFIPLGEHPEMTDAAADNAAIFGDGLHPTPLGQGYLKAVYAAAVDSIVQNDTGAVPDVLGFVDQSNVALSTVTTSTTLFVRGMGIGQSATASVSGAGTFSKGQSAFGTTSATVVNGDAIRARATSSGSNTTPVDTTVTAGGVSDTFTITTVGAAAIELTNSARVSSTPGDFLTTRTYTGVMFPAGRLMVCLVFSGGNPPDTVTIDGQSCVQVTGSGVRSMWLAPQVAATSTTHTIVCTRAAAMQNCEILPMALPNMTTGGTVTSSAKLPLVFRANGNHAADAAITVNSGGIAAVLYYNEGTGAQATKFNIPAGWTLVADLGVNHFLLSFVTSQTPTINSLQTVNDAMLAGSFGP